MFGGFGRRRSVCIVRRSVRDGGMMFVVRGVLVMLSVDEVIAMFYAVDHRSSAEEQQRLEEGVRYKMEHARRVTAESNRCDHKSKLADGTVRQHFLDVPLAHRNVARHERGQSPDDRDYVA